MTVDYGKLPRILAGPESALARRRCNTEAMTRSSGAIILAQRTT